MPRVLLIRFSSLGDVALTSALIEPLLEKGYEVSLLSFYPFCEIFKEDERIKVHCIRKENYLKEFLKLPDFDYYLDLHKNTKSFLLRFIKKGNWISYKKETLRRRLSLYFKKFRRPYSVVLSYLETLKPLNAYRFSLPKIKLNEERLNRWRERLGEDYIALGIGARYKKKEYPYFKEVSKILSKEGFKVVILGSGKECERAKEMVGINLCGKTSLLDAMAVIKNARIFVGNDSGLLHLARCVRTKAVQIYGGTHPTLGFSLFEEEGKVLVKNLDCQPCSLHGEGKCKFKNYKCLEIPPEEVVKACLESL